MEYPLLCALKDNNLVLYKHALHDLLEEWVNWDREIKNAVVQRANDVLEWILTNQSNYNRDLYMPVEYCRAMGFTDTQAILESHGFK